MSRINVPVAMLDPLAKFPAYAKEDDAGFDLAAIKEVLVPANTTVKVGTGLAMAIPAGYCLDIRPRSGVSANTPLLIKNAPGTIDSGYRGEIGILVHNLADIPFLIPAGYRVAQGVFAVVPIAEFELASYEDLTETDRGTGGFGHTGAFA
jgi:dUTP pyrophosphatase